MNRAIGRGLPGPTLIALIAAFAGVPGPARAASDEPFYVSHEAQAAVAADVDHDGARELVLVRGGHPTPGVRMIEIWDHDGTSGWDRVAADLLMRPAAGDAPNAVLDAGEEAFGLLAWRDGAGEQALLVSAGDAGDYGGGCCLALGVVELEDGHVEMRALDGPGGRAESVLVMDADADGIDELIVNEPVGGAGDLHALLLRWTGEAFVSERVPLGPDDSTGRLTHIGETDGVPGDEALYVVDGGRGLLRIGLAADGTPLVERAVVGDAPDLHLWAWGAAGGAMVVQVGTELRVLGWPRGGELSTLVRDERSEYPVLSVVGEGPEAVIVDRGVGGFDPRNGPVARLLDLRLEPIGELTASDAVRDLWRLANIEMPALQGQLDGLQPHDDPFPAQAAYIAAGSLLRVDPGSGFRVESISSLTGMAPVGVAGPAGGWWILADGDVGTPESATLIVRSDALRTVSLVPERLVLQPESAGPEPQISLQGAVLDGERLAVPDGGFDATVDGPAGSLVLGVVDQWVVHEGVLPDAPVSLRMESLRRGDGNQDIEAAIVVIDPAGRVSTVRWAGDVLRQPPQLTARADGTAFLFRARIVGHADIGATVTVDGRPASTNERGAFEVDVDAPFWPRDVLVVARDVIGNEAVSRLQVVGFLDYRGLPWVAIVGVGMLAAAFAFLRAPRRSDGPGAAPDGAGLEEIDAD